MINKQTKWLIYTVLIGLIPIIFRMLIWLVSKNETVSLIAAPDIISFGFILHISVINEIEHVRDSETWKTIHNGFSILFLAIYAFFSALMIISEEAPLLLDVNTAKICVIVLAFVSLVISFSVFHRLSSIQKAESGI